MDESVKVCLKDTPICLSVPVKFALLGLGLFIAWKVVALVTNDGEPDQPVPHRGCNRMSVWQ